MTQQMPVHPFTGLAAIGFRRNGDPIWPVKGGSGEGGEGGSGESGEGGTGGEGQGGEAGQEGQGEQTDWKAKAREWEKRAKANSTAAKRLAEIEEAQKSEAEKAAERLAKAEQTAKDAEARALRREVALEHKLGKDDAALLDAIVDEGAMRALAARLGTDSGKKSNYVPREGNNTKTAKTAGDEREFVRELFGSGG